MLDLYVCQPTFNYQGFIRNFLKGFICIMEAVDKLNINFNIFFKKTKRTEIT